MVFLGQQCGQARHRGGGADQRQLAADIFLGSAGGARAEQGGQSLFKVGPRGRVGVGDHDGGVNRLEGGSVAAPVEGLEDFKRLVEAGGIVGHVQTREGRENGKW